MKLIGEWPHKVKLLNIRPSLRPRLNENFKLLNTRTFIKWFFKGAKTPLGVFIISLLLILGRDVACSYSIGYLENFFNDPVTLLHDLLLQPTFFGFLRWLQLHRFDIFIKLQENGAIPQKSEKIPKKRNVGSAIIVGSFFIFPSWLITTWNILPRSSFWVTADETIFSLILAPTNLFVACVISMVIVELIKINVDLYSVFKSDNISVQALHPDGAGGLGEIGKFPLNFLFLIVPILFTYTVNITYRDLFPQRLLSSDGFPILIPLIFFLLLAPIIYFAPIFIAHKKMVEFREKKILLTSIKYEEALIQLSSISSNSPGEYEECLKKIKALKEQWAIEMSYPTWPFKIIDLNKYFGSILSSVLLPIIVSLIEKNQVF